MQADGVQSVSKVQICLKQWNISGVRQSKKSQHCLFVQTWFKPCSVLKDCGSRFACALVEPLTFSFCLFCPSVSSWNNCKQGASRIPSWQRRASMHAENTLTSYRNSGFVNVRQKLMRCLSILSLNFCSPIVDAALPPWRKNIFYCYSTHQYDHRNWGYRGQLQRI